MLTAQQLQGMTGEQAAAVVDEVYQQLDARRHGAAENDAYFRGQQRLLFASATWAEYHRDRYKGFSDNWCQVVPTVLAERVDVTGFSLDPEETGLTADEAESGERILRQAWRRNEMESQSSQGILQSTISATSTVLVWRDPDADADLAQITWKRPDQAMVVTARGNPRQRLVLLDSWCDDDREYADLFTAAALWKFSRPRSGRVRVIGGTTEAGLIVPVPTDGAFTDRGGWVPRTDDGDLTWPVRHPMGAVPGVEVPNRPMLGGAPISEVEGAKAMQNAINLLWAYLFTAADHASMPARVVMGQEPPKLPILDTNGVKIGERPVDLKVLAEKRILWLTSPDAKIGQWDASKLDVFTGVMVTALRHLSSQTRTPLHSLAGELTNINGETLVALDAGLISKALEFCTHASPSFREINALVAKTEGIDKLAQSCRLGRPLWKDPEIRLQAQAADAAVKDKSVGLSMMTILMTRYRMTQAEAEEELARIEAEQASDPLLAKAIGAVNAAAAGQDPGQNPAQDPAQAAGPPAGAPAAAGAGA